MRRLKAAAWLVLVFSSATHAGLLSGFEPGLEGWDYVGDVSIQTSAIGLVPTQAERMAFISTMCDRNNPPSQGHCNTTTNEHPYSGISSPPSAYAREFLGLPLGTIDFLNVMPYVDVDPSRPHYTVGAVGESGAIKMRFLAPQAGFLSFDWNRIGKDGDTAYFSLWSDDGSNRVNDWIFYYPLFTGSFSPSGVDLCSRYYNDGYRPACRDPAYDFYNFETGWSTRLIAVTQPGWYWIGFGLGEVAEGTAPTVLALDNLRFQVSEPKTLALLALGLVGLILSTALSRSGQE
jgi:hypothetical protein